MHSSVTGFRLDSQKNFMNSMNVQWKMIAISQNELLQKSSNWAQFTDRVEFFKRNSESSFFVLAELQILKTASLKIPEFCVLWESDNAQCFRSLIFCVRSQNPLFISNFITSLVHKPSVMPRQKTMKWIVLCAWMRPFSIITYPFRKKLSCLCHHLFKA